VKRVAITFLTLGALLWPAAGGAEHEVYYRYTVLGYVKDARGRPVRGREVTIVRDKTGFSYLGESDAGGLYVVTLRLGDESLGERLTVRSGTATASVTVRFDAGNRTEERGTRLDVEGVRTVERPAWFPSTLARFLGTPVPPVRR
jgi:hypothetical protein